MTTADHLHIKSMSSKEDNSPPREGSPHPCKRRKTDDPKVDECYFKAYSDIDIHADMIGDRIRTTAYRLALLRNYESIRGKVVMDIGAGTGILSMFCVQAGAKKVYAVEASEMAEQAEIVIKANRMEDRIVVLHDKVEDVNLPEKVDVIVSEWMGYLLLYETMLPSVLYARNKWLKKDGFMFPSQASLFMAPYSDSNFYDDSLSFWDEVEEMYKVDMSGLKPYAQKCLSGHVHVRTVLPEDIMSHAQTICTLDLKTMDVETLNNVLGQFNFKMFGHAKIHGFVCWFDVQFPKEVTLSTSPYSVTTHWEQSILYLDHPFMVEQDTNIQGSMTISPNKKNSRYLEIVLDYRVGDQNSVKKSFNMTDHL